MSNDYFVNVVSSSKVTFDAIATEFACMDSENQAIFLSELFDALKHKCGKHFDNESQLWWIAKSTRDLKLNNLLYTFETLNDFNLMRKKPLEVQDEQE